MEAAAGAGEVARHGGLWYQQVQSRRAGPLSFGVRRQGLSSVDSAPNGEMSADPVSISVRVLVPADAAEYHAVRRRALQETPPAFGSLPDDQPDVVETARALATSEDHHFFGAFHDGRLVGIVRLSHCEARNEKHRAYLAGLYTLPPFRRRGCGRALIRAVLDRAASTPGIRRVNLSVVAQQEVAIRLYRSIGFRIYGTEPEAFSRDGQFYDEHLMTLELTQPRER